MADIREGVAAAVVVVVVEVVAVSGMTIGVVDSKNTMQAKTRSLPPDDPTPSLSVTAPQTPQPLLPKRRSLSRK
jgi:hypothetical protein